MEQMEDRSAAARDPELARQIRSYQAEKRRRKRRRARAAHDLLVFALAAVFFLSAYKVGERLIMSRREQNTFAALAAVRAQGRTESAAAPENAPAPGGGASPAEASAGSPSAAEETAAPAPETAGERRPLPQYAQLHEMNGEFFGWLTVEAVGIDYPVMYSPERPEYYLYRDFNEKKTGSGTPFIDGRCPADGNYYLIYGHLMENKTVFGRLPRFADEELWRENPRFRFDTVYEEREYEIVAAFYSRLYDADDEGVFRYYDYFDLSDPAVFEEYMRQVREAALYDTGVDAAWGDELLVLSTCSRHDADGRFVLVAKRIK